MCDTGFTGVACQMSAEEKEEFKQIRKTAILAAKEEQARGKLQSPEAQKDFVASFLADNDDEADIDPEVINELAESQADYAAQMVEKLRRKRNGETLSDDEDID